MKLKHKKIKIAIVECHPHRAKYILNLLKKTKYSKNLSLKVFPIYKNKFPDLFFDGAIYSGGGILVSEIKKYHYIKRLQKLTKEFVKKDIPVLGICLGHQLIANTFGGKIEKMDKPEIGFKKIKINKDNALLRNIPQEFYCFNYHEEFVSEVPKLFDNLASSEECKIQFIKHKDKSIFGIQFHPEYDKDTSIKILDYYSDELLEGSFNLKKLINETEKYSKKVSVKIFENFIKIILEKKLK